ncbi:ribosomal protein S18 acetylase RimI-like enzyme [Deinococcus sp. HSC-46F16]|uniref:GNAT family N-acetyltransferase n=1 Tax=Deinococcus sp. HSC-46F16 TaxID=2910968 RepID=UPI0020A0C91D|nr:GNAT family N-acetyltransferase [Deinococcus sp. HSC-46F16]MCP2014528.1 ribosomal protein S18 acetylase RimI-like enzyme [Deinococcus sp. HSC-46F16]
MVDLTIAPLEPADAPAAQRLVLESFAPRLHPYMTATQHGSEAFLAAYLQAAALHPDRSYLGAKSQDAELLGYAEFRQLNPHTGFLSYICVSPEARGQRLAQRLIEDYLAETPHIREMQLDVFADNLPALTLYGRMGFEEVSRTTWWRRILPSPPADEVQMLNWPQALAAFELYGFCELQLRFAGRELRLGRMGESVLRCPNSAEFADDGLLAAMRAGFPTLQEALLIGPATPLPPHPEAEAFNQSLRLRWQRAQENR